MNAFTSTSGPSPKSWCSDAAGNFPPGWTPWKADDLPELRSLAAGMCRDLPAVISGLTLEHSSGAVEGNVTRIKRLKRDGYGRANFDLLRIQILLAA